MIYETNITLHEETYFLEVKIKKNFLKSVDRFNFVLKKRHGNMEIILEPIKVLEEKNFKFFHFSISPDENKEIFNEKNIWDFYISRLINKETFKTRIKGNDSNLRLLSIVFPDIEKIFYPFTTAKGNLSFYFNDYYLFADIENISFLNDKIFIKGYFNYPPLLNNDKYKILETKLIITNNCNDNVTIIPLKRLNKSDLLNQFQISSSHNDIGFTGVFPINKDLSYDEVSYFKFYLELTYEFNNIIETIRSTRIRWNTTEKKHIRKIVKLNNQKLKVLIKPTKKAKYLSLQISNYKFYKELITSIKKKWVEFRRSKLVREIYRFLFYILSKFPSSKNLIIFESFHGKQYSDSPRAIYEYLLQNKKDFIMHWSVDRRHTNYFKQNKIKHTRRFSIKWLLLMTRAKYWVTNSRLPLWLPKPRKTIYIQTWHGTPLKRLAADMDEVHMPGTNTEKYKINFLKEASKWDYLISPNAYSTEIFKRAFDFKKNIVESGYPRNDYLINNNNENTINHLKSNLKIPRDKKIILYAPTWRDNQFYTKGRYKFDLQLDLEKLKLELGNDYILLLRLHYLVAENLDLSGYENFIYDFSKHEDIRELYLIADMLITDYSSVFFDYANLRRPMLFYVYDIEEYRDNLRGFYFDFEKNAPGPLVKTTEELINEIKEIEINGFTPTKEILAFYDKFCYLEDGHASERVVNEIFLKHHQ